MDLNFFIIVFIVSITNLILGLFVFFRNWKSPANFAFFGVALSVSVWSISNYIGEISLGYNSVLFWTKMTFFGSFFIPAFFLFFSLCFPVQRYNNLISKIFIFLPPILLSFLLIGNTIVSGINSLYVHPIEPLFGPFYPLFGCYFITASVFSFIIFWRKLKIVKVRQRIQIYFVLAGFFLALILASITNLILPAFGYSQLGNIGPLFTIIFVSLTAYAIVKHHLMDIRFIVVKSITYFFLFFTIILVYTFFIFIFGALVFKSFTGIEAYWASMIVALTIAFTIQPIKRVFTRWTDRIFFKDNYNFEELTSKLNEVATSTIVLPELLFKFLNSLMEKMRITRGALILIEKGKIYETESIGYKQAINLLPKEIKHLVNDNKTEVFDEIEEGDFSKDIMRSYNTSLILHLKTEGETIGFLFLGEKKSGDIYSFQDIRVLEIITDQVALGIQNAKAYEKTQKFNLVLRAEIDRATKELRDVNDRLVQADKSKDEFISLASHEIRTPIAALEGYLSMLNLQKVDIKARDEIAKRSYESVERLSTLVKDLLDVSRIDQKRIKLNKQPTRLERLIQRAMEGFELQTRDKKIYIKFQKPEKMLQEANIDPERVGEVFNNLISNAIKYTYKGGITISLEEKDNMAQITVSDTGMGIPKNAISHLFQKFYQAETASSVLSNERGGTGLGLYISKNIVEMHGGKIWVESTEGKGTAFYFTLPLI